MNLHLFHQARRIALMAMALALVGYFTYLLVDVYRSRSRLLVMAQERALQDTDKKAAALGYFFAERREDLLALSEHRDLQAYFENEALGMSMEYGLGASLEGAQEVFQRFRDRKRLGDRPIYARITLITGSGAPLLDARDSGLDWPARAPVPGPAPRVEHLSHGTFLVLAQPFHFKGRPKGTLLAWLPAENIFDQFVGSDVHPGNPAALACGNQWAFQKGLAGLETLPEPGTLGLRTPTSWRAPGRDRRELALRLYRVPIQESTFSLVACLPGENGGGTSPGWAIGLAGGIGIIILAGAFGLFRSEHHNRILNAKFRAIFSNAGLAIALLDREGRIQDVNARFSTLFRQPAEALRRRRLTDLAHPDDRKAARQFMVGLENAPEQRARIEHRFLRHDGEALWGEVFVTALRSRSGEAGEMVAIILDQTEARQAEQERLLLESQLRQAQKLEAVAQLAGGMAHEINTPIQFIGDNADFLAGGLQAVARHQAALERVMAGSDVPEPVRAAWVNSRDEEDMAFLLEEMPRATLEIRTGTERVAHIIRAMMDFSHSGSGQPTQVDLHKAIESVLAVSANNWRDHCEVVLELDPRLPLVTCFPDEMNQVLLALVLNAADAIAEAGKGRGTLTLSTRLLEARVEIRIRDTGTGIPEEIRTRIFDPFFTTKEVGKGTGQGLTIAHHVVVEKHRGSLRFETAQGLGTVFILEIPLHGSEGLEDQPGATPPSPLP